jgi:cobalamin biosynthesis Mg chelatase CobN
LNAIKGRVTTGGSATNKATPTTTVTTANNTTTSNALSTSPKGDARGRSTTTDANAPMEIRPVEAVMTPSTDAYPPRPFLFPVLTLVLLALVVVIFWWTRWHLHTLQDKVQRIESLLDQLVALSQQQQQQQQLLSPRR